MNNDTEYNDIHREVFHMDDSPIIIRIDNDSLWHCEKPMVFDDHVLGYGWQRIA